jgi:simple sugar transport system ATP-binding protein
MRDVSKRFPPDVRANDRVSLDIRQGEILALLGENGAGKSTLMQILYGVYRRDGGELRVAGETVDFASPRDAIRHGIGMIHQEFMLVRRFSVAENIAMGTADGARFDLRAVAARITALAGRFGLNIDPWARVEDLPVGVQQRVEILKLLYREARLLILDEPTAVLTPQEVARLFEVLRALRAAGKAIVIVTHKLREVIDVADRVTVLRDGRAVATVAAADTDETSLARLMVGRDVLLRANKPPQPAGRCLLDVAALTACRCACMPAKSLASPGWTATASRNWSRRCSDCGRWPTAACCATAGMSPTGPRRRGAACAWRICRRTGGMSARSARCRSPTTPCSVSRQRSPAGAADGGTARAAMPTPRP